MRRRVSGGSARSRTRGIRPSWVGPWSTSTTFPRKGRHSGGWIETSLNQERGAPLGRPFPLLDYKGGLGVEAGWGHEVVAAIGLVRLTQERLAVRSGVVNKDPASVVDGQDDP